MTNTSRKSTEMAQLALFSALIIMLAFIPGIGYIPLGVTRATIIHVPVIIGSIVLGPKMGAILGGVFGLTSLINNTIAPTVTSFVFTPFYEIPGLSAVYSTMPGEFSLKLQICNAILSLVICFVPRILIGVTPYFAFKGLMKLFGKIKGKETISLVISGICGAMTNTILVMSMIYLFFGESYAAANNVAYDALLGFILGIVGVNGVLEAITAAVLACVICKVLFQIQKRTKV